MSSARGPASLDTRSSGHHHYHSHSSWGGGDAWLCTCPPFHAAPRQAAAAATEQSNGDRAEASAKGREREVSRNPAITWVPEGARRGDSAELPEPCGTPGEPSGAMRNPTSPPHPPLLPPLGAASTGQCASDVISALSQSRRAVQWRPPFIFPQINNP